MLAIYVPMVVMDPCRSQPDGPWRNIQYYQDVVYTPPGTASPLIVLATRSMMPYSISKLTRSEVAVYVENATMVGDVSIIFFDYITSFTNTPFFASTLVQWRGLPLSWTETHNTAYRRFPWRSMS